MSPGPSLSEAVCWAKQQLQEAGQPSSKLEAEVLLCHLLQKNRSHLYTWPEQRLPTELLVAYQQLIQRRATGEPIAYLTGHREFWSLDLLVTPAVLIPRADTELLVEQALLHLDPSQPTWVADLGTGSGAIAAAIASERPLAHVIATDQSADALALAQLNFQRLDLTNIDTAQGCWCDALPCGTDFDLIVSNPPYIPSQDPHLRQGDLPFEPQQALVAGKAGLDDLRCIASCAFMRLRPGGYLLVEHGQDQGESVRSIFQMAGLSQIETHPDLERRDRVSIGRR